jgi:hypothetical protein
LLPNIAVDRLDIGLSISCVLILATCALVLETIALHPLSTALAIRAKSTEALQYFDKILAINPN